MQHWGWPARGQGGFPPDRGYIKRDKGQGQRGCGEEIGRIVLRS